MSTRDERIAAATRDLVEALISVELSHDLDPYPASVPEVADEIARYVVELETSGLARGLVNEVRDRLDGGLIGEPAGPDPWKCRCGTEWSPLCPVHDGSERA